MNDISLISKDVKGEFLINKITDFPYDDVLFKYISYKPMVDIVSSIRGPNVTVFHNMLINKPPNADPDTSRHPMHQDLFHFPIRPADSLVAGPQWKILMKKMVAYLLFPAHTEEIYNFTITRPM